jgi:hypothetical protein
MAVYMERERLKSSRIDSEEADSGPTGTTKRSFVKQ